MVSTFQWMLTVLLSILFTYLFVRPSVEGSDRTNPRKKLYDAIYPDLPDLQSLTESTLLRCSCPDPDPLRVSCGKPVEALQKDYALSILRAIVARSPDAGAPTEMLSELAECHFCATHRKQASDQLKKALRIHWCATWANCKPTTNAGFKEGHDLLQGTAATRPASAPDFVIPSPTHRNNSLQGSRPRSAPLSPPVTPTRAGQSRRSSKELRGNAALSHSREHRTSRLPASPEIKDPDDCSGIQDSGMWVVTPIPPGPPHMLHDKIIQTLTPKEKTSGYVYILQKPGCSEYYKIGFTEDSPERRLKQHLNSCFPVGWIRRFSNEYPVSNAKRVELLVHLDLQMRGCRVHAPCWNTPGSRCRANHREVFRGNLDELSQSVEFWCKWMTYYDPYDDHGEIKPSYTQYTIEVDLEAKSNLLQRKFCSRSYGELWVCKGARRASAVDRRTLQTSPPAAVPGRIPTTSPSAALADSPSLNTRSKKQQDRRRSAPAVSTPMRGGNTDLLRPHLPPSASDSLLGSPTLRQSPRLSQAFGSPASPSPSLSPGPSESNTLSLEDLQGSQDAEYLTVDGEDPLELWECKRCFLLNGGAVADCEVCASREIFDRKGYIDLEYTLAAN